MDPTESQVIQHSRVFRALVTKARTSFLVYLLLFNPPGFCDYVLGAMHVYLARLAQKVIEGKAPKRQIISVPPQHGKSTLISKEFVSWVVGFKPGVQVALTGFSHDLVTDFSKWVRARVQSPVYQLIFPGLNVLKDYDKGDAWSLSNGSGVRAKSCGKKLTGRKVDLLIIDDAHSGRQEAESSLKRRRIREWYFGDCLTRLSPGAAVFIIGTRWHPEDLSGHLTSEEYEADMKVAGKTQELFHITNFPALSEGAGDLLKRESGEPLFPEVRNKDFLESIRASIPPYEWDSQFQGKPRSRGSGQVDLSRLAKITLADVPKGIERARGWDLALTTKASSDFTAGALCAYDSEADHFYIIDMVNDKWVWTMAKPKIVARSLNDREEHGVMRIGMEGVSGFSIGCDEVRSALLGEVKVEKRNPKSDKLLRAQPWLNKIEAGKVSIVRGEWNRRFLAELAAFPDGDNDDQVDAVSVAYEMLCVKRKVMFA